MLFVLKPMRCERWPTAWLEPWPSPLTELSNLLYACTGRVVVSGMGKSGIDRSQDRRYPDVNR